MDFGAFRNGFGKRPSGPGGVISSGDGLSAPGGVRGPAHARAAGGGAVRPSIAVE